VPSRHHLLTVGAFIIIATLTLVGLAACGGSSKATGASPHPDSASAGYAWAVGDGGVIMATTDGGARWNSQNSGTTSTLASVAFADAEHGWAAGGRTNGETSSDTQLVLTTSDGGVHWARQTLGQPGGRLFAVACTDSSHVWVGGQDGTGKGAVILASTDDGATWTTQYADHVAADEVSAIAFADATHGWALTGYGKVLATWDGGAHWAAQRIPAPRPLLLRQVACSDADHCWIVGVGAKNPSLLLASTDGGTTWRAIATPKALFAVESVRALDARRVDLGGLGRKPGAGIFTSTDGGAGWRASSGTVLNDVLAIAGHESGTLWAVSDDAIAASTDGGSTWTTQTKLPSVGSMFHDVACPLAKGGESTSP
jgi:photosystem II stability/assembly factor-like uncharacterized protein